MVRIHRSSIRSEKVVARQRRRRIRVVLLVVILCTMIIGVGIWFFSYSKLMIGHVLIGETRVVSGELIQNYIEKILNEKYMFVFPKRHILMYPQNGIREGILKNFTWLKEATVELGTNQSLIVEVTERKPTYLWCRDTYPLVEMTDEELAMLCYFADNNGYLFAQAPYFSDIVYVKVFGGQSALSGTPLGSFILPQNEWSEIIGARSTLLDAGLRTHSVRIFDNGDRSFGLLQLGDLWVPSSSELKLSGDTPMQTQIENIFIAIKEPSFKESYDRHDGKLEYIDARIENSIYYRFTGGGTR